MQKNTLQKDIEKVRIVTSLCHICSLKELESLLNDMKKKRFKKGKNYETKSE